jgi:hypothetical protein
MTMRVLPFFASEEAPHHSVSKPAMKLIQDAVAALKQIKEKQQPAQALIASISAGYKQINAALGAGKTGKAPTTSVTAVAGASSPQVNGSAVVGKVTASVKTIEEVSQRLSRILGFLRQGGAMSTEEITRRLGTLEQLLADRVVELGGLIKELGAVSEMPQSAAAEKTGPDGLVLVSWNGAFLAIPTSAVIGVYQINKSQAEQFADKSAIVIAGKQLKRFPLKKPQGAAPIVQTWLVHLKSRGNEYFLMSEKVTGFRKTPVGVDTRTQKQVKIGPNTYMIIDPALLK